tara:strand:- start:4084 stop:4374 length:291 start_codon:yes stop_codon:yes gene_type:complete
VVSSEQAKAHHAVVEAHGAVHEVAELLLGAQLLVEGLLEAPRQQLEQQGARPRVGADLQVDLDRRVGLIGVGVARRLRAEQACMLPHYHLHAHGQL